MVVSRGWLPWQLSLLGLVVFAFAVRTFGLNAQSLWHDEGASLYYASQDPLAMIGQVAQLGEIPPLYYLLLHFWLLLAGTSELALRLPSVIAGVLSLPLLYQLGRRLGSEAIGLLAAMFLLLSPLHVWQSQEARMYTLSALVAIGSILLFWRLLGRIGKWSLAAYALLGAAGLYTHVTFGLMLLAEMAYLAFWTLVRPRRLPTSLAIGGAAALSGLLFVPWLGAAFRSYGAGGTFWAGRLDVILAGRDTLVAFLAGERLPFPEPAALALAALALAGLGLLAALLWRPAPGEGGPAAGLLLAFCLLVPAAALFWLLYDRPKYGPRYLLVVLPAFCLLAAWGTTSLARLLWRLRPASQPADFPGVAQAVTGVGPADGALTLPAPANARRIGRWRRWLATGTQVVVGLPGLALGLGCLVLMGGALRAQLTNPAVVRDDYRGAAAYLAATASADDAIILLGGHIQLPFLHYYQEVGQAGKAPVFPVPNTIAPAVQRPVQIEDVKSLNSIVPGRRRVWVVRWQDNISDPAGMIMQQLELAGRRVDPGKAFAGLQLDAFDVVGRPTFPVTFRPQTPLEAPFDNGLTLLGFDLSPANPSARETLHLTIYWRADGPVNGDYVAFTQLLNAGDHIYAQHDKPPVSEQYKTSSWAQGDMLKDEYELVVRPGTPPGQYRLLVGLYDRATMRRVPVRATAGAQATDHLDLAQIGVAGATPSSSGARSVRRQVSVDVAPGVRLVGYEPESDVLHPGETPRITLLWQTTGAVGANYDIRLVLREAGGREVAAVAGPAVDGTYPTARWRADDLIRDIHNLPLPPDLAPGSYELAVALVAPGTSGGTLQPVGVVDVK
ncbi:MAG: glycosyltransferase family 39 protein [Chloroflexi bacterium]|nr:glycosyltransferase family 39 protein [Chloroflexota bacterium]MCL5110827.1 glycosyltransferase family 39 protein [Chloroflexota bacterium]